jgi:hypothetical protein
MGDRGQVLMKNSGVFLYTHWGACDLIAGVQRAIAKKLRWDDEEYLTRIIFDEMIGEEQGKETGFGIGTIKHDDIWLLIVVDCDKKEVTINNLPEEKETTESFEDFIKHDYNQND